MPKVLRLGRLNILLLARIRDCKRVLSLGTIFVGRGILLVLARSTRCQHFLSRRRSSFDLRCAQRLRVQFVLHRCATLTFSLVMVRSERIRTLDTRQGWINLKRESMTARLLHLRIYVRLNQADVGIALEDIGVFLVNALLVLAITRVVPLEWHTS